MKKEILITFFAFILTILFAIYQRHSGPTYPVIGKIRIDGKELKYKFYRSENYGKDIEIKIRKIEDGMRGIVLFRKYPTNDEWNIKELNSDGDFISTYLPTLPPAGKVEYQLKIYLNNSEIVIPPKPVILRVKGKVPSFILIPHIIIIFLGLLFTFRMGIKILLKEDPLRDTVVAFLLLLIGGLILGPIVQKFAFGAFWTGYPFGKDMTDNKTLFAVLSFIPVLLFRKKSLKTKIILSLFAFIVVIVAFSIPHSYKGSEIDWKKYDIDKTYKR